MQNKNTVELTEFSPAQLEQLRKEFSTITRVDPKFLPKFRALFARCGEVGIRQLATAGINFVSSLALNESNRRERRASVELALN